MLDDNKYKTTKISIIREIHVLQEILFKIES